MSKKDKKIDKLTKELAKANADLDAQVNTSSKLQAELESARGNINMLNGRIDRMLRLFKDNSLLMTKIAQGTAGHEVDK